MNVRFLLDLLFLCMIKRIDAEEIIIKTSLGNVVGEKVDNYMIFRGIPYTENPPIGKYRFGRAEVKTTPYNDGIYRALDDKLFCIQPNDIISPDGEQSEDCLYLTIFAPNIGVDATATPLAVMAFIHGGGMAYGAGSVYDTRSFMRSSNVIFVGINYRLGPLGFLASNTLPQLGMNGINDQIVALQWIKQYIADYGGDPNKVTIFGESAGGAAVCYLSLIPKAKGLFNQAIIQSGSCFEPNFNIKTRKEALTASLSFLNTINVEDNMEALRAADASLFRTYSFMFNAQSVDGYLLSDTTKNMLLSGNYHINPNKMIMGTNNMDSLQVFPWSFLVYPAPQNDDEFVQYLKQYIGDEEIINKMKDNHYPLTDFPETSYFDMFTSKEIKYSSQQMRWAVINADVCFKCALMFHTEKIVEDGKISPDNLYSYNLIGTRDYITHGADLGYLFYDEIAEHTSLWTNFTYYGINVDTSTKSFSYYMSDVWTRFGANGIPKSELNSEEWKPYGTDGNAMYLGNDATNTNNGYNVANYYSQYRKGVCPLWINDIGWDKLTNMCFEVYSLAPTSSPTFKPKEEDVELFVDPDIISIPQQYSPPSDQSVWINRLMMIGFVLMIYNIGCCYCIVNGRELKMQFK